MTTTDVVELVKQAKEGSSEAFAKLYDMHLDRVYAYVVRRVGDRALAEDLTSDVFMNALRRISRFTPERSSSFIAWLLTIARNRVTDHYKSARFRMESSVAETFDRPSSAPTPEARVVSQVDVTRLHTAIARMRPEQAEVLQLRFLEQLDVSEVAAVMGKKEPAIRALQYRALKSLAALLADEGSVPRNRHRNDAISLGGVDR